MALTPQDMAAEMEHQLRLLWLDQYGHELPEVGQEQRNTLFLAVARGVLKYLKDQEDGHDEHLFSEITLSYDGWSWTYDVENLEWNVDID